MKKIYFETPTKEIWDAVQDYLIDGFGMSWWNKEKVPFPGPSLGFETRAIGVTLLTDYLMYAPVTQYRDHGYVLGSFVDLKVRKSTQKIEVTVKVNGVLSKEPLSVQTARNLGIVE